MKEVGKKVAGFFGATERTPTGAVKTAPTGQIDAIKADRVTTAKAREEKRILEQVKRDAALAKTGETMTTAVGDQTTVISSIVRKEPPIVEVPYGIDNASIALDVMGI